MGWLQLNPTGILAQLFAEPPHPPPVRSDPFAELGSDISDPRNMYEYYQRQLAVSRERLDAYRDYEDMDYDDLITSVLDALAEDCTQQDFISQRVVWIESENADVKDLMTELLDNLKIEERAPKIIRETAKYGDAFYDMVQMPGEGVLALDYMDPKVVWRHEVQGILKGWQLTKDLTPRDDEVLPPWLICHFMRTTGREQVGATYGDSFIRPARRLYRKYQMVEDAMILYRLRRAPDRDVYYVDVGTAPSQEAPQIVRLWRSMLKKTMWYSPQQPGKMRSELNPLCLVPETPVPLVDGRTRTMQQLLDEYGTEESFSVYSYDKESNRIVEAEAKHMGVTGTDTEVLELELDDGSTYRCTPHHKWVLKGGDARRTDELQVGDALEPLYRRIGHPDSTEFLKDYEFILSPAGDKWWPTHWLFAEPKPIHLIGEKCVRHHKNFNGADNRQENIEWMTSADHYKLHAKGARKRMVAYNKSPEHRAQTAERNRLNEIGNGLRDVYNGSDEHLVTIQEMWSDEDYRQLMSETSKREMTEKWRDPEFRGVAIESIKQSNKRRAGPGQRAARRKQMVKVVDSVKSAMQRAGYDPFTQWDEGRQALIERGEVKAKAVPRFKAAQEHLVVNHKVLAIRKVGVVAEVHCLHVLQHHNFAVGMGNSLVFTRNSYDEDLFWPIRENSNSRVERLTGSTNTDQIYDVEMLMNRLFSTIRAPKEYFGFGDDRSLIDTGKSLAQQDIRWARGCKSLQHSLTRGIMNIGAVHMALLGINPQVPENEFQVHMTPVSNLDEQQRAEIYDARTQVMDSLNRLVSEIDNIDKKAWLSWMMTKFGGLPPHLLDQFIQDAEKEGAAMDGLQGESLTESDKVVLTRHLGDLTGDFSNIVGVSTSSATLNGNLLPELVTS